MIFRNALKNEATETIDLNHPSFLNWLGIDGNTPKDKLAESTYFACMKILAETLGKLPLNLYQSTDKGITKADHMTEYNILKLRPNPHMTSATFWSTVEMNRNHYGNAYVYIRRKGARVQDLWIMKSEDVALVIDDAGLFGDKGKLWYRYTDPKTAKVYTYHSDEVMHFKTSMTFDGIVGMSVQDILKSTIDGASESQNYLNNLYKQGMTGKAVLEYTGDLDDNAKTRLVKGFEGYANGSNNAGKIIPVPLGMRLVPLDIKLADSQFFELRKYTSLQIAAAFGVKPTQINDYEKASYASAEAQNLAFYTDTLLYPLNQYEQEITYKVLTKKQVEKGHFFKYNVGVILRADTKTQIESITKAISTGLYTPNEGRSFMDLPSDENGDVLIVNGTSIPLSMLGANYNVQSTNE